MKYPQDENPWQDTNLAKLSKAKAQLFIEWFISRSEPRIAVLTSFMSATGGDAKKLDKSPQSLIPLWEWALTKLERESPSEYQKSQTTAIALGFLQQAAERGAKITPQAIQSTLDSFKINEPILTAESVALCKDIAYYYADVLRISNIGQGWALNWLKGPSKNRPVYAFTNTYNFSPEDVTIVCANRACNGNLQFTIYANYLLRKEMFEKLKLRGETK